MEDGPRDPTATELRVELGRVRYRAPDDGFAIVEGITDDGELAVLTGPLGHLGEGETITATGRWSVHAKHGHQFAVERSRVEAVVSERALRAVLERVKHIGPVGAALLVQQHGPEIVEAIDRDPSGVLSTVPGIGRKKVGEAVASWEAQRAVRAVRLFLEEHGVPAAAATRIVRALGSDALGTLQHDPYRVAELDGVGFATADALARALGVPADAPERLDAGILHALQESEADGHCFLPRGELAGRAEELLGADVTARISGLGATGRLVLEEDRAHLPIMHAVERRLARRVVELAIAAPAFTCRTIERPAAGPVLPTDEQWAGITAVLEHRISILTGGPGTGKTAAMRGLVELLAANRKKVVLCAPTGKAARRLAESTGAEAGTIHRLLEWLPGEGFARGPDHPIDGADVVIVDEASMLGVQLADALIGAIGPATHVLLVGDTDQLAPVGPGRVLEDLIDSGRVPATRLTQIFRQAAKSMIVQAAHAINRGERPRTTATEGMERDVFLIERDRPEEIVEQVVSLVTTRLPGHYDLDPMRDILVLAPMHRGPVGIDALNEALRAQLNPGGAAVGGTQFRVGDRLIETKNDYEADLMNGELGVLIGADPESQRVTFAADDGRVLMLPTSALETMRLAHAISVHKAQGSQAPAIVLPLFRGHAVMLTTNLIYTAVSRAERLLVLVGQPSALELALRRRDARRRHTRLTELVAGACHPARQ